MSNMFLNFCLLGDTFRVVYGMFSIVAIWLYPRRVANFRLVLLESGLKSTFDGLGLGLEKIKSTLSFHFLHLQCFV